MKFALLRSEILKSTPVIVTGEDIYCNNCFVVTSLSWPKQHSFLFCYGKRDIHLVLGCSS